MSPHAPTPPRRSLRRPTGFTLIEVALVVAIVAVVVSTGMPSLQALIDARRLEAAATDLLSDVQLARSEAVARDLPVRLTLQATADGSCFLVHTGDAGDCACAGSGPAVCSHGALAIKSSTLRSADRLGYASRTRSLLFDPLHGTCTPAATLRVLSSSGREVDQIVNVMGRTRSCTPNGAVSPYRAC